MINAGTHAGMAVFAETGALQPFGTLIVLAIVAGMAAFGFQYGLFLAILAGMGALATLLVTFGLGEMLAGLLTAVEMPADYALPASIGLLAVGGALAVRFAIGGAVGEETLRFSPLIDKIGGVLIGGLAGMVIAGTLLVVLSAMPIPAAYSIDGTQTKYDLGTRVLKTFARLVEPDAAARDVLLNGEGPTGGEGSNGVPTAGPETSELFIDSNDNGLFDAEGEAAEGYLDHDGDGQFTPRFVFSDGNKNGAREIGLLERYRLRTWQKLRVLHYPMITSGASSVLATILGDGQEVYKAVVTDLDPGDQIVFSLREPAAVEASSESTPETQVHEAPLFAIDPASGSVTVKDAAAFMRRKEATPIVVVATDKRGLATEKTVSLIYRGAVPGQ